jgi:hypothetical protein
MILSGGITMTGGMIFSGDAVAPPPPPAEDFQIVFTKSGATTLDPFTLPLQQSTGNITVDWGDSTANVYELDGYNDPKPSHTYGANGSYTVSITGTLDRWGDNSGSAVSTGITEVLAWGNLGITNFTNGFDRAVNLTGVPNNIPVTATALNSMFERAINFNSANVISWDVGNVLTFNRMFWGDDGGSPSGIFNQDIGGWDTSSATAMGVMFRGAAVFNQDLTGWCVTNIPSLPDNFATGSALDANNYPVWGTCP